MIFIYLWKAYRDRDTTEKPALFCGKCFPPQEAREITRGDSKRVKTEPASTKREDAATTDGKHEEQPVLQRTPPPYSPSPATPAGSRRLRGRLTKWRPSRRLRAVGGGCGRCGGARRPRGHGGAAAGGGRGAEAAAGAGAARHHARRQGAGARRLPAAGGRPPRAAAQGGCVGWGVCGDTHTAWSGCGVRRPWRLLGAVLAGAARSAALVQLRHRPGGSEALRAPLLVRRRGRRGRDGTGRGGGTKIRLVSATVTSQRWGPGGERRVLSTSQPQEGMAKQQGREGTGIYTQNGTNPCILNMVFHQFICI